MNKEHSEMKKTVCSLFLLSVLSLGLAGCNPTDNRLTITWWNDYAQTGDEATTQRYDYVQGVIEEFEKLNPDIHVVQENHQSYGTIASDVTTGLNGGNIPNLASVYPDNVVIWDQTPNAILHPEQYFEDAEVGFGKQTTYSIVKDEETDEEKLVANTVEDSSSSYDDIKNSIASEKSGYGDGDLLTLPYSRSSEALFINQTVFDKVGAGLCGVDSDEEVMTDDNGKLLETYKAPTAADTKEKYEVPTDWTEMIALARQMKMDFPSLFADQRDSDGWFKALPICYDSGDNMFISFCKMMNIPYTDNTNVLFNNADAKAMMVQLKKWNNEGLIGTADQLLVTDPVKNYHEYSTSKVNYGQCFLLVSSTTSGMYMGVDGYRIGVYQTPTIGGKDMPDVEFSSAVDMEGEHYAISQGPSLVLFRNANERVQKATFDFYKFLTNSENGAGLSATTGYFAVRPSSNKREELKDIIDSADKEITDKSTKENLADKSAKYKGLSYQINEQYIQQGDYFIANINDKSAAARTAVGNLVNTVFNSKAETDAEIEKLVEDAFKTASGSIN